MAMKKLIITERTHDLLNQALLRKKMRSKRQCSYDDLLMEMLFFYKRQESLLDSEEA